ncbi:MAG TPA: nucleoside monophosphate kinase, partial [Roseimicrobium sp.]|nr:nucleoside monophosphate kinase [Roseimicrobium sp.]
RFCLPVFQLLSPSIAGIFRVSMKYKAILLFGAPGSGKGTQGKILGAVPGFYHSSTGDIFRSLDLQSEMGRIFWEYAGRGQLVPDEFTIKVWKQFIKGMEFVNKFHPESEILVLDGLPRNVNQARLLEDTIEVLKVVHLVADNAKMVERLRRRALKENRFDDANDAVVKRRLEVYEKETAPLLAYYPPEKIVRIEAMQSQIRVLSELVKLLVPLKEDQERDREEEEIPAVPTLEKVAT